MALECWSRASSGSSNAFFSQHIGMHNNYFTTDNLQEVTDISAHLAYASTLLDSHSWSSESKKRFQSQLAAIKEKQSDKSLNISVIGEFASGKSTFINALMGLDLLEADVLQGTTVAITIIEYGSDFEIELTNYDGTTNVELYNSVASLKEALRDYTTNSSYAKTINYITVKVPSPILRNGFRIIDTPGTNSLELWHEDITRRAIKDISDVSIIVIDATKPMTQTLMSFMSDTLKFSIKDCSFVLNKIDLLREDEVMAVVKYIQRRAKMEFELEMEPVVLPFASLCLMQPERAAQSSSAWQMTLSSLDELQRHTARKRKVAQARKLMILIESMYCDLTGEMNKMAGKLNKELTKLERSRQTDLQPFLQAQIIKRQQSFAYKADTTRITLNLYAHTLVEKAVDNIFFNINIKNDLNSLKLYVKTKMQDDILAEAKKIVSSMESKSASIGQYFQEVMKEFQREFDKEFEKLDILPMKFEAEPQFVSLQRNKSTVDIGSVSTVATEELVKENLAFGSGMAVGALIGSSVLPLIGTIIGGIIGGMFGGIFAPNNEKVKVKIKDKLKTPLEMYFRSVVNDCKIDFGKYVSDVSGNIAVEIAKYQIKYNEQVAQEMLKWERQCSSKQDKINKIKRDLGEISNRQNSIRSLISHLQ